LLRQLTPLEAARDPAAAREQMNRRSSPALHHGHGPTIEGNGGRPDIDTTRESEPRWGESRDIERKSRARAGGLQVEPRRPQGQARPGGIIGWRAPEVGEIPQHPVHPGKQGSRNFLWQDRCDRSGRGGGRRWWSCARGVSHLSSEREHGEGGDPKQKQTKPGVHSDRTVLNLWRILQKTSRRGKCGGSGGEFLHPGTKNPVLRQGLLCHRTGYARRK